LKTQVEEGNKELTKSSPTVFTRYQLVEFGNYLLSDERKLQYEKRNINNVTERLYVVNHADVENYIVSLTKESKNVGY
jgi:hypothetical protein